MRTEVIVVLDRSGSMASIEKDVKGGYDTFIKAQREVKGECYVTLVQFDTGSYDLVYERMPVADVPPLSFHPRSGTNLLDAIGRTVTEQGERFASSAATIRPEAVVPVIITDGQENSSKEWTREKVFDLLKRQQDEWKWEVTYIGANQDAIQEAQSFGIPAAKALNFKANTKGVAATYAAIASNVVKVRSGGALSYTVGERNSSMDAGEDE